ncbi:receptor-like protein 9DC1 isoform X2 [Quercus robur]|uniref:receptor-like protein 9DC1 isoform X2 n=1 Tax=Quercus robur TaxID=38942 RepID=UPI002162CAA2|nr:receptor-like protein 9DC1 isoform X2 [Quercus robur]
MGTCLSWKYFSLLLSLLFFHSQFPFSSSFSSNSQCSALLHFNHSLSLDSSASSSCGSNSYPKTGSWKEDKDCCTWDGVVCDNSTRHVIALDLTCSSLHGSIDSNSTLFLLRHLRTLNLAGNIFDFCQISPEFGKFQSLTHLNFSSSAFSGEIPYEISQLSSLVSLDLSFNLLLIKTPVWKRVIGNLTQLRELVLDGTDMPSITSNSWMMNLSSSLATLSLQDCGLQGKLELNIFRLPSMQTLDLRNNPNLEGSLPKSNWSSSPLKFLALYWTSFSGELPDSIGSLKSLEFLDLSYNNFSGLLPSSIFDLPNLSILDLSYNQLVGPLPNHLVGVVAVAIIVSALLSIKCPVTYKVDAFDVSENINNLCALELFKTSMWTVLFWLVVALKNRGKCTVDCLSGIISLLVVLELEFVMIYALLNLMHSC